MTKEKKNDDAESSELDHIFEDTIADGCACSAEEAPDDDGNVDSPDDVETADRDLTPEEAADEETPPSAAGPVPEVLRAKADTTAVPADTDEDVVSPLRVTYAQSPTDKMLLDVITEALAAGEGINLQGVGFLSIKRHAARKGRNPQTGESMHIPAANRVHFKPATALRDMLNQDS